IGSADDSGGLTVPAVTFDFDNSSTPSAVPCDCCPIAAPARCALSQVRFSSAAETASQSGWIPQGLSQTADGITSTPNITGYNSPGGTTASTTVNVTYTAAQQWNRVRGLRLWNQTGNDLNDSDGLGTFTADFYSGALLIWTASFAGINGGAAQDLLFPFSGELNGVDRVILRDLGKLSSSTVAPTWRELQLLVIREAYPCRRSSGVVEWYDPDGNLVPSDSLVDCGYATASAPSPVLSLVRFTGTFFGDGPDPAGENICNVSPAVYNAVGFVGPPSGCVAAP